MADDIELSSSSMPFHARFALLGPWLWSPFGARLGKSEGGPSRPPWRCVGLAAEHDAPDCAARFVVCLACGREVRRRVQPKAEGLLHNRALTTTRPSGVLVHVLASMILRQQSLR